MNPNQPMLLTFELQPKQMTSLRIICIRNGIQLVKADPAMYGETIEGASSLGPHTPPDGAQRGLRGRMWTPCRNRRPAGRAQPSAAPASSRGPPRGPHGPQVHWHLRLLPGPARAGLNDLNAQSPGPGCP